MKTHPTLTEESCDAFGARLRRWLAQPSPRKTDRRWVPAHALDNPENINFTRTGDTAAGPFNETLYEITLPEGEKL